MSLSLLRVGVDFSSSHSNFRSAHEVRKQTIEVIKNNPTTKNLNVVNVFSVQE
jgi:hypothetical protein